MEVEEVMSVVEISLRFSKWKSISLLAFAFVSELTYKAALAMFSKNASIGLPDSFQMPRERKEEKKLPT